MTRKSGRSVHRTGAMLLLLAGWPVEVAAQTVTGAVLDAVTSGPLSGVLVSLLDLNGERIRATLSDEAGRFFFELQGFGRFSLRAERIGLQTTTSESFDVISTEPYFERILMGDRAVEIAGLTVDSRVQQCRLDRDEAVQIQRWWREVRTALDVSSVVQSSGAQFEIERFQREWDADLEQITATDSRAEVSISNRPFASAEADFLSEGGFVQGELAGQREYYAPDADVLLSSTFLTEHCFSIEESRFDPDLIGLAFEPIEERDVPDIEGVIWVDSTTAELKTLDFRYTSLGEVPDNEAGGSVWFEYLPSGAWIVRSWYIRMPRFGQRLRRGRTSLVLLGYVDVGGQVSPLEVSSDDVPETGVALGAVRGLVWDSIRGRGLADATVAVFGTDVKGQTDEYGRFYLPDVPAGDRRLTFFHDDTEAWGLGGTLVPVEVREGGESAARLAIPTFRQVARIVCLGSGGGAETVLMGRIVDAAGDPLGNLPVAFTWLDDAGGSEPVEEETAARTGADGRFVVCTLPAGSVVAVKAEVRGSWTELFRAPMPPGDIVFRRVMIPVG